MGLDMYLYARRYLPEPGPVLDAAEVTASDLRRLAGLDPRRDEPYLYLSGWPHAGEASQRTHFDTLEAGGMMEFAQTDYPDGLLGWDGRVYLEVCCAYWHKANAIHAWFVDECQGGVDECQRSPVHPEQLASLRSTCAQAIALYDSGDLNAAAGALSPRGGFFFGSTAVGEWRRGDASETVTSIDRVVTAAVKPGLVVEFSYQASW